MSVRRLDPSQPREFTFSPENLVWAEKTIDKYPEGKQASAVIPLLWRAQEQNDGWLSEPSIRAVAKMLDMAEIRVLEIATFYTMFNLSPVGKYFVQLCGTTPCWLRGADDLKQVCREVIGPEGKVTEDGLFSWLEVECLGACVNAPMVQINKDYYEDLTAKSFAKILDNLKKGKKVEPGPQVKRHFSCPDGGPTTLLDQLSPSGQDTGNGQKPDTSNMTDMQVNSTGLNEGETVEPDPDTGDHLSTEDVDEGTRPDALESAREGGPDDLKKISGIGSKLEGVLNELGIFHYGQIAEWTEENTSWIDRYLSFKGRVKRERWIEQAKILDSGGNSDFSDRYEKEETEEDS